MRTELWVRTHCFDGDHENEYEQAATCDLVACARTVRDHRERADDVYVRMVSEDEVSTVTSEAVTPALSPESVKTPVGYGPEGTPTGRLPGPGGI